MSQIDQALSGLPLSQIILQERLIQFVSAEHERRLSLCSELEETAKSATLNLEAVVEGASGSSRDLDRLIREQRRWELIEEGLRSRLGKAEESLKAARSKHRAALGSMKLQLAEAEKRHEAKLSESAKKCNSLVRKYNGALNQSGYVVYNLPEGKGRLVRKDVYDGGLLARENRLEGLFTELARRSEDVQDAAQILAWEKAQHAALLEKCSEAEEGLCATETELARLVKHKSMREQLGSINDWAANEQSRRGLRQSIFVRCASLDGKR
jgi:hypothetical protein